MHCICLCCCRWQHVWMINPLANVFDEPSVSEVRSRGAVINSALIDNWENLEKVTLASGKEVSLPWADLSSAKFDEEYAKDIKKEDGWVMLFHTMNELNLDEKKNYIFFYNQLTGFMKVFYYEENRETSAKEALWDFRSLSKGNTALFNLNDYVAFPDNERPYDAVEISNMISADLTGFSGGWNGFEMEFPYTQDYKDVYFGVSGYGKRLMSFTFSGTTESVIEGTLAKISERESKLLRSVAALGGKGIKSYVDKLCDKNKSKAGLGKKIIDALADVSARNFASALLGGLKFAFGSSTVTDNQYVKLTSKGTVKMEGSGSESIPGTPFPIGNIPLYEVMNAPHTLKFNLEFNGLTLRETADSGEKEQFLGVWTLKEAPKIYYQRYSRVNVEFADQGGTMVQKANLEYPYGGWPNMEILINPNLEPYITHLSSSYHVVMVTREDGEFLRDPFFQGYTGEFIYFDDGISIDEMPVGQEVNCLQLAGLTIPKDPDYQIYYDWGETPPEFVHVIVTVNIDYKYNGKKHNVVSSRLYKANCMIDPESGDYLHVGKTYVINTGKHYE